MKGILVAALIGLIASNARALDPTRAISQYAHTAWRNRDGFFAGAPSVITQTTDGYIWVGTTAGLQRFDGVRFTAWNPPEGGPALPSADILSFLPSGDGSLWIGTGSGLAHWHNGRLDDYPGVSHINSIREDREGHIWIARSRLQGGAGPLCEVVGLDMRCYGKSDGIPVPQGISLAIDTLGRFWLGGEGALTRWAPGSVQTFHPQNPKRSVQTQVVALATRRDGGLWVGFFGTGHGLGLEGLAKGAWQSVTIGRFHGTSLHINALFIDPSNGLWAGTDSSGIYRIRGNTVEHFDATDGLSGDDVQNFFEDVEHNLWVATSTGIDCFRDLPVVSYTKREGLTADEVNSVDAAANGTVWVGIVGGLDSIRNGVVSQVRVGKAVPGSEVTAMLVDHSERLWLGVDDELYRYENEEFHVIRDTKGGRSGVVTQLAEDADGSLWAVVQDASFHQLLHIRNDRIHERFPEPEIAGVALDAHGGLWLDLVHSVVHWQNGVVRLIKSPPGIQVDRFEDVASDHQGALWAVTNRGVLRSDGQDVQLLGTSDGLPCVSNGSLIFDRQGSLWLMLRCGIVRIDPSSLHRWIENPKSRVPSLFLDVLDGVQGGVTDFHPSMSIGRDGRLWFVNGTDVEMLDPAHLHVNEVPAPVHIEQLVADHRNVAITPAVRLPPLTRDIEIDYTALSFVVPQRVHFHYELEGHDREWQDSGTRRSAFYTNLAPGKYRFKVTACNSFGIWNSHGTELIFVIPPAWYQTMWFRSTAFLCLTLLAYAFYLLRMRQYAAAMRARFNERLDERVRIARELHDTLLQSFHGLLFRFQAARNLMFQKTESAVQVLDEAIVATERALTEGRDAIRDLRPESLAQHDLVELLTSVGHELAGMHRADEKSPTFRVIVEGEPQKLSQTLQEEIYRIGREVIRNAFHHAAAGHIEAEIRYDERELRLRIRDDGRGIAPKDLEASGRPGHWGLQGIRERAQRAGSRLEFWSETGAGTEVELKVPAEIAYEKQRNGPQFRLFRWGGNNGGRD